MQINATKSYSKTEIYRAVKKVSNDLLHQHKMKVKITKTPETEIDPFFEGNDKYRAQVDIMAKSKHDAAKEKKYISFIKEEENLPEQENLGDIDIAVSGKSQNDARLNLLNYISNKIINVQGFKEKGKTTEQTKIFKMPNFQNLNPNSKIKQLSHTKEKGVWEIVG